MTTDTPTPALSPDLQRAVADWPKEPRESAGRLVETYGDPDEATSSVLTWHAKAKPWKRTVLSRQQATHDFPSTHQDFVQQTIDFRVPVDKVADLAAYDRSVIVDGTRGELSARCGGTSLNFLAINLAVDLIEGRRSVDEARSAYADIAARYHAGDEDRSTQGFLFDLPAGDQGDPDRPVG